MTMWRPLRRPSGRVAEAGPQFLGKPVQHTSGKPCARDVHFDIELSEFGL